MTTGLMVALVFASFITFLVLIDRFPKAVLVFGGIGLAMLAVGQYLGLFWSPPEAEMKEVGRILYVHVPAAWVAMMTFTISFLSGLGFLFTGRRAYDWMVESSCEVGVVLTALLITLGSIFARNTWGVWWSWDPRLTASAVMLVSYVGILFLRSVVSDPDRRAMLSAAATVISFINVPIVYFVVRYLPSLHQMQSTPETVDNSMVFVLRTNSFAFMFLAVFFLGLRYQIAKRRGLGELPEPLPPEGLPA